jgi:Peptidase C13 family
LLKKSGIRWKVVVISACYGGGFIDPVKDDTTLVITATRHDRRSFRRAEKLIKQW